jgi:WD40 repeat protein
MPADYLYDAFISYSQKLDKPFVRRLQRQLQDLGKAWWQRRAVRIFRDESSLSATPGLWPAIERALEGSRYLIVCASPEAADSHWLDEEVRWWLAHKSRDTLLIALTAGELHWDKTANDFAWNPATPLPPAFKGAFASEPKWVDFRPFRTLDEERRKADEAFLGLAADLSSTIRGIAKEDLLSEEVRQQRRALRTAYGGAGCLGCIAAVAITLGIIAYEQRAEAQRQRDEAQRQKQVAVNTRNEALLGQSKLITGLSESQDKGTAALLLLEMLPDETSKDETAKTRPLWPITAGALKDTLESLRERWVINSPDLYERYQFSPNDAKILTGSDDGLARFLDAGTGAQLAQLSGHTGSVWSISFSPDGTRVLTGSEDQTARLWDAKTGETLAILGGHSGDVLSVAFSPDGTRVITGGDKVARLWDTKTGLQLKQLEGHKYSVRHAAFSPDGRRILTTAIQRPKFPRDKSARLWNAQSGAEITQFQGHQSSVTAFAFNPNAARLATAAVGEGEIAVLWDARSGARLLELKGHEGRITSIAFSPDGARILTGSGASRDGLPDYSARLWDANTGKELLKLSGHEDWISSAAFHPGGMRILTGSRDKTARIWDAETGAEIARLNGHTGGVSRAAFSHDGSGILTSSHDGTLRFWNTRPARELNPLNAYTRRVRYLAFSPEGSQILIGSGPAKRIGSLGSRASLRDAHSGEELTALDSFKTAGVTSVAFSPDGAWILLGSTEGTAHIWDAKTGKERVQLKGHSLEVTSVAFSPDSTRILTGSSDRTARLWDASTAEALTVFEGHLGRVTSVAFSPDGTRILTGSDTTARLWDAKTGLQLKQLKGHSDEVNTVAFSRDGALVLTGSGFEFDIESVSWFHFFSSGDNTARLWDANTGAELRQLKGHSKAVLSAAFSADGARVLTGSIDGTLRVWDTATGRELVQLRGYKERVASVAFSPDRKLIVSGSDEGLRSWEASSGQELIDYAKRRIPRCLTQPQRDQFYLSAEPPSWCIEMEKWPYHTKPGKIGSPQNARARIYQCRPQPRRPLNSVDDFIRIRKSDFSDATRVAIVPMGFEHATQVWTSFWLV